MEFITPHVINSRSVDGFKNNLNDYWRVTGYMDTMKGQWPIDLFLILIVLLPIKYKLKLLAGTLEVSAAE